MTIKREEVFNAIKDYIEENGYSPSVRDICKVTGRNSTATITYFLKILKSEGYIDYNPKLRRTIKIVKEIEE